MNIEIQKKIIEETKNLRYLHNYPTYPPYHEGAYIEEYFFNFFIKNLEKFTKGERYFLPIWWTDLYIGNKHKDGTIQKYLDSLDKDLKYFTVTQHDNAIQENYNLDLLHYSAGGNKGDKWLPLCCSPIKNPQPKNRDIFIADRLNWVNETVTYMLCKCHVNDELMNEIWEKTIRKIYFKNGYYDFNDHKMHDNDMNSFVNISRDLSLVSNPDVRKQIYEKVLNPIFSIDDDEIDKERVQLLRHWLYKMSRVMAGFVEDKEAVGGEGNRNCGKGVLSDMLGFAFGGYVGASNAENFLLRNRNDEEAKKNSFMYDWQFKRLIVCNEVSFKEYGATVFDGNLIKKAHSGGDFIEMRQLYVNKTNVRLQATVLFNLNDLPKFNPADAREKLVLYNFNSKFVKTPLSDKEKFSNIKYYQAVDSVKTEFIKREDVSNEFVLMLIEAFKTDAVYPPALLEEQIDDLEDDNDINSILNLFEITKSNADRLTNKELKEFIALKKISFSFAKVSKLLCGRGCKRIKNGSTRFITGLLIKSS